MDSKIKQTSIVNDKNENTGRNSKLHNYSQELPRIDQTIKDKLTLTTCFQRLGQNLRYYILQRLTSIDKFIIHILFCKAEKLASQSWSCSLTLCLSGLSPQPLPPYCISKSASLLRFQNMSLHNVSIPLYSSVFKI